MPSILTLRMMTTALLATLVGTLLPSAHAEKADSQKEMVIEAEHLVSEGKSNTNTFTGDVVITRGTLLVKAERAVAVKAADEFQHINLFAKPGAKIHFRQKRDGGADLWVEGEAEKAEYDEKTEFVKFISKAHVRYLDGKRVTDEQEGEFLSYDSKNDVFVGSNSSNGTQVNGGGRIKMTIQPKNQAN
ncbi:MULTISPECIES: lipopolysaccharide transport periplasmic protein LptA [unclassified Undibacterium]|uniref:lipopolysaccharide transport periplasmic protein LptA n=1 Tax=unclassified Undibacterium TaxID=2630295 RepID=UPI002AC8B44C|nr:MULTISPECIES: lipopolysaccharide transport periplasmic protein LptA [unclassified Undibacterium]MEB0140965.1 lipopolysaccharide transport periplasmic protein LptA [Undibacterium sp. CCC2.1]MEB0173969.1 lipopolysaccharide transport periplasmic protein LptA [Undibacterium sp. CCC1.1]MEB0177903.1 lipopolysaccharide transport periplasmic protein LptA [Undibacterium sp. CCC3.4]MEB0217147.1 lipopolysaccharide transport periplasmic protein LptA [Undibacterium sp. 5I2]WPX44390.1 lipopolysaccharide 